MKKVNLIYIVLLINCFNLLAQSNINNDNKWQIGFSFGEIPILSGSFKPGITAGYHFNDNFMVEFTYQLKDYLQRDDESFNAVNIGFEGLESSKETTGERIFLGVRYKPVEWSPYLTAGMVINIQDVETIKYDSRERVIGNNNYDGKLEIVQKRKTGAAPAVGFGYQYDFSNGLSINTNFAMAFFNEIQTPSNKINADYDISESDMKQLDEKIIEEYKGNFHNRYHIFNLGIIYRFGGGE